MASEDILSTTANVFSTLSFAELVFKCGQEVFQALVRIQRAPKEIGGLIDEIKDIENYVLRVLLFLRDFESSDFSAEDKEVVPWLHELLKHCKKNFDWLQKKANDAMSSETDSWFRWFNNSAGWVMSQEEISWARRQMLRLRNEIDSTLGLVGRKNELAIHAEVRSGNQSLSRACSDLNDRLGEIKVSIAETKNQLSNFRTSRLL
ncbi:hypothetical protein SLS54_000566 [Diplodia seriata]